MKNTYPEDLCKLTLDNIELVEDSLTVINAIEEKLFSHIVTYLKKFAAKSKLIEDLEDLENSKNGIWKKNWQLSENSRLAYFYCEQTKNGDSDWTISSLLGCRGAKIAIKFYIDPKPLGLDKRQVIKILNTFYNQNEILQEKGFYINQEEKNSIDIDFNITKEEALNSYFHNKHSFKELDNALEQIMYSLDLFDSFIKSLKRN